MRRRGPVLCTCLLVAAALSGAAAAPASASLSGLLAADKCSPKDADGVPAATNLPFTFCDDGVPDFGGDTLGGNPLADKAVAVPAKYQGAGQLPPEAPDAATVPGANLAGDVALDVDISLPDPATSPMPAAGYPVVVMMHGCCSGSKTSWEGETIDPGGSENWHYNNAWFASRGYVVVNYTSRGFVNGDEKGSTGQTQLDSDLYEMNDYQHLVGQLADLADVNPDAAGNQTVDPANIVPTGGSYGGGFSWMALVDPTWQSPGGKAMKVRAVGTKYGWTNLVESLVPRGDDLRDALPSTDPASANNPIGFPKRTINNALYLSGKLGFPTPNGPHATFAPDIDEAQACLTSGEPYETNPLCTNTRTTTLPRFITERSAYFQNDFFSGLGATPQTIAPVPVYSAGTLTDTLFPPAEHRRMVERLKSVVPGYPVQEHYGDYNHFVQNKRKEWSDLCGPDRHVCTYADYPAGNLNQDPTDLRVRGVTSRLNRFLDHYAKPPANTGEGEPAQDVTAALQVCPQNAAALGVKPDEPGPRFTEPTFAQIAPNRLRVTATGAQATTSKAAPNPHAVRADPVANTASNGSRCPVESSPGGFASAGPGVATYDSQALPRTFTMVGQTRLTVQHTGNGPANQLNARLYDLYPDGTQVLVDRGVKRIGGAMGPTTFDLHGNGWRFLPGHKLRIEIAQDDDPYIRSSNLPSSLSLAGATLDVPVREGSVEVGGAAAPIRGGQGSSGGGAAAKPPRCASSLRATRRLDLSKRRRLKLRVRLRRRSRIAAVVRRRGRKRLAVTLRRRGPGSALVTLRVSRAAKPGRHRLKVRISCAGTRSQVVTRRVRFVP